MNTKSLLLLGVAGLAFLSVAGGMFYTVDQTSQAIILQFGELKRVVSTPGLKVKLPFIQDVIFYENRVLDLDLPAIPLITFDKKRLLVDTYTRYRIADPSQFFQTIKPANEQVAGMRLETLISGTLRNVIGRITLPGLLSEERTATMEHINEEVARLAKPLGIEIVDIRIIRTDLPNENRKSVFEKMNSEQILIAKKNRADGAEAAQEIRSTAEKERTILIAEAEKEAQEIIGKGEAAALKVVSDTLGKDPEFYGFYRALDVYQKSIGKDTTMVLSSDSDIFKYFNNPEKVLR